MIAKMKSSYLVGLGLLAMSPDLFAAEFRCNQKQTRCSVEHVRLTIGDRIGILNEDKELVAMAEVDGIQGKRRRLSVKKRYGRIMSGYKVARMDTDEAILSEADFRIYKKSSDTTISAIGELGSLAVGEGVITYGAQGVYESKLKKYLYWTGRGFFQTGSGNIRPVFTGTGTSIVSASAFGAMGGLAYKTKRKNDFVFRSEAALGFGYMMADIDGEADLADSEIDQISNGIGLAGRLEVQAVYAGMSWNPAFVASYGILHSARQSSLGVGFSKALD